MNSEKLAAFVEGIEHDLSHAASTRNIPAAARQALHAAIDSAITAQRILLNPEAPEEVRLPPDHAKWASYKQPSEDSHQQALTKLAENNLRITIDGRTYAARVVQKGEIISGATIPEDSICAFEDGALVKTIPVQEYLINW